MALFFAQFLWKLFASLVPYTSRSMDHHDDLYTNRGSHATMLLLEYSQDVFENDSMEHDESVVEESSQRHLDLIEEGGPEIIFNPCSTNDLEVSGCLPRRKRGRPRRSLCNPPSFPILPSGESLSHSFSGDPLGSEGTGQTSTQPRRGPYYTRAKKTWLMGKLLGLEYPGTDEEAIKVVEQDLSTYLPEDGF